MKRTNPADPSPPTGLGRRRAHERAAVLGLFAACLAGPAAAQVIEIAPDGEATTYAAPAVFTQDGVRPIAVTRPRPAATQPADVQKYILEAADRQHISAAVISEVARRESRFRQTAVSSRDAVGVMQLTAETARGLGVDRYDAEQNIYGGAAYLRGMLDRYSGDLRLALAAYNAGPGAVDRYRGVPPFQETQAYVSAIIARLSQRALVTATPTFSKP
jgi:soluble lytic murein transglycosylase-like protein